MKQLRYLLKSRNYVSSKLDVQKYFEDWEEACVSSEVHMNTLARKRVLFCLSLFVLSCSKWAR